MRPGKEKKSVPPLQREKNVQRNGKRADWKRGSPPFSTWGPGSDVTAAPKKMVFVFAVEQRGEVSVGRIFAKLPLNKNTRAFSADSGIPRASDANAIFSGPAP